MFGAFQSSAFQANAFQIIPAIPPEPERVVPGGYVWNAPYHKYREEEKQRERIRRDKSELEKLESVLAENERKKLLAAQSLAEAKAAKSRERLARLEQEYIEEINRLLVVRASLIRRARANEALFVVMVAMRKRKLRVGQWQAIPLAPN